MDNNKLEVKNLAGEVILTIDRTQKKRNYNQMLSQSENIETAKKPKKFLVKYEFDQEFNVLIYKPNNIIKHFDEMLNRNKFYIDINSLNKIDNILNKSIYYIYYNYRN